MAAIPKSSFIVNSITPSPFEEWDKTFIVDLKYNVIKDQLNGVSLFHNLSGISVHSGHCQPQTAASNGKNVPKIGCYYIVQSFDLKSNFIISDACSIGRLRQWISDLFNP